MFFCYRQKILGEIRQYQSELGCNSELPSIPTQVLQYRQYPLELGCNSELPSILTQVLLHSTGMQYPLELGYNSELPSIPTQVLQYRQYPLAPGYIYIFEHFHFFDVDDTWRICLKAKKPQCFSRLKHIQ